MHGERASDVDLVAALLRNLEERCQGQGMALYVVLLMASDDDPDAWQWLNLGQRLDEAGIAHSSFQARRLPADELWYDRHLSARGHRRLASHVRDVLRRAGVL